VIHRVPARPPRRPRSRRLRRRRRASLQRPHPLLHSPTVAGGDCRSPRGPPGGRRRELQALCAPFSAERRHVGVRRPESTAAAGVTGSSGPGSGFGLPLARSTAGTTVAAGVGRSCQRRQSGPEPGLQQAAERRLGVNVCGGG
jgi:hypothetical protein